jgi:hypothetical protein
MFESPQPVKVEWISGAYSPCNKERVKVERDLTPDEAQELMLDCATYAALKIESLRSLSKL